MPAGGQEQRVQELLESLFSRLAASEAAELPVLPAPAYVFIGTLAALRSLDLVAPDEHDAWQTRAERELARIMEAGGSR